MSGGFHNFHSWGGRGLEAIGAGLRHPQDAALLIILVMGDALRPAAARMVFRAGGDGAGPGSGFSGGWSGVMVCVCQFSSKFIIMYFILLGFW